MKRISHSIFGIIAVMLCVALLSGCEMTFFSPRETVRSPKPTGYFEGVQEALEKSVGEDIILKYPSKGEERSAFSAHDFDGDGTDEVVAFYQLRSEGEVTRMSLISYASGEWVAVQNFSPVGNDLEKIAYTDIDGDGADELVAGWTVTASAANKLVVYGFQKGMLVQRASEEYTDYVVCDIDNNGSDELGIVKLDKTAKTSKMVFYSFSDVSLTAVGSASLDGNVLSYAPVSVGKLKDGKTAVYLDGYKDTNTMITELIYHDGTKITDPFIDPETMLNTATIRYTQLMCTDINSDGITDIPFSAEIMGYNSGLSADRQYLIKWQYFDSGVCRDTATVWYSKVLGFYFDFDREWEQGITVAIDGESTYAVFSLWDSVNLIKGEDVFRIRVFTAAEWNKNPLNYYSVIYSDDDHVWAVSLSEIGNSSFKLDLNSITRRFHVITQ